MSVSVVICPLCHGTQQVNGKSCKKCKGRGILPLVSEKCPICGKSRAKPGKPECDFVHFGAPDWHETQWEKDKGKPLFPPKA